MSAFLRFRSAVVACATLLASAAAAAQEPAGNEGSLAAPAQVVREAFAMGTRLRIVVEAAGRVAAERASEAVLLEVERLEGVVSTWRPGTELARLNAVPPHRRMALSAELAGLLGEAWSWAERTDRAFDPTLGALVDAWGVRGEARAPSDAERAGALRAMGPVAIVLRGDSAARRAEAAWIDSGAFGKGAALRGVTRIARRHGVDRMLVDLGGQLWAEAPGGASWSVSVAHPFDRSTPVARLAVHGASVATSGESERPGHLLDPRTGHPVGPWGSVTVVAADALEADVLSTALYVMGPVAGLEWARVNGTAALFLQPSDVGLQASWTKAMDAWLEDHP